MAGNIQWFRWHHGSVTDPKFQLVSRKSGASLSEVIAIWAFVLESASASDERGNFGDIDHEAIDCMLGLDDGMTQKVIEQMAARGIVSGSEVSNWDKRQPKKEDETANDRKRRQREREHELQLAASVTEESQTVTPCHAESQTVTPRHAREEKRREEKKNTPQPPKGDGEDDRFAEFWSCWPENERRQDKAKCRAKWARDGLGLLADQIFADVEAKKCSDKWRAGYVEAPLVYLNNRRWEDVAVVAKTKSLNRNSDEYAEANKFAAWWRDAGFPSVWAAIASRCWHDNADQFHDGQRVEVAA